MAIGRIAVDVSDPPVRAVYGATTVPDITSPYDVVQFRVDYPAAPGDPTRDPTLGIIPPDPKRLPLPVVVLHGNFNCGPELYRWWAHRLAMAGVATVSFSWVAPLFGGRPGLSTGVDLDAVAPDVHGTRSPHRLLPGLLQAAADLPDLRDCLDLGRVVLGGHSAGGTLALLAANPIWHPGVIGAFSYGGHTRAQTAQGHGRDAYLALPGGAPVLLMGGTADGVVTAIAEQQGQPQHRHPMQETFERAVPSGTRGWLVMIEGADHYAVAEGYDGNTGRGYLEPPGPLDPGLVRERVGTLVCDFVSACCGDHDADRRLDAAAIRRV